MGWVFAVQAADFIASMVRLDALARHDKKRHDYQKLFKTLSAQDYEKFEKEEAENLATPSIAFDLGLGSEPLPLVQFSPLWTQFTHKYIG
jgi:hypothetical protein